MIEVQLLSEFQQLKDLFVSCETRQIARGGRIGR
jgi:hypothetical protein